MERLLTLAEKAGFSQWGCLDMTALEVRKEVRDMCASDRCHIYGKNWSCPPYCGTLEECTQQLKAFHQGILVQTVGKTQKRIDTKAYRRIEEEHLERFRQLTGKVKKECPKALCLGSGGCRICPECAWPETCRFPEKALSSMEAYGLFVSQICAANGIAYHHGDCTVTYTSCILFP